MSMVGIRSVLVDQNVVDNFIVNVNDNDASDNKVVSKMVDLVGDGVLNPGNVIDSSVVSTAVDRLNYSKVKSVSFSLDSGIEANAAMFSNLNYV